MPRISRITFCLIAVFLPSCPHLLAQSIKQPVSDPERQQLARFEVALEKLWEQLKIPAYSAAIVKNQAVIWARGFGYADLEKKSQATENTAYHLASLTKTFGGTILLQLVKEGEVNLDDPVTKYGIARESQGVIRVKHLLSHTSAGNPGEQYQYDGDRFAELSKVIAKASGRSFGVLLIERILEPLGLDNTAPNVPPRMMRMSTPNDPNVQAALQRSRELMSALNSGNADALNGFASSQNSAFNYQGEALGVFPDAKEFANYFRNGVKLQFELVDLEAVPVDNVVLTTSFMRGTMVLPGQRQPRPAGPWRTTMVWILEDGVWRILHAHLSDLQTEAVGGKQVQRFAAVSKILAQPYRLDSTFTPTRGSYPTYFSVSAGLISTVMDMARFDIALDRYKLLDETMQQMAWRPSISTKGDTLPYGLAWFTTFHRGQKFIWHYGYWTCNSSLILKVPSQNLTFIIMANTDNLSRPTSLGSGDLLSSPVGLAFLKEFVFPDLYGQQIPEIDWRRSDDEVKRFLRDASSKSYSQVIVADLQCEARISSSVGDLPGASRLFAIYGSVYSEPLPTGLTESTLLAKIERVGDFEDRTAEFRLDREQRVRIFALGEGFGGQLYDYGWLENAETGDTVWQMKAAETTHAGGADKNRMVDVTITVPTGRYKLRYKSDDSHSFDRWNAAMPRYNFWGIAAYAVGK